ncbi:MAG: hypothetical protein AB9869_02030 [Verrucomicrobiia bacterium]
MRDIPTLDDWTKQRPELSRQLLEMLGLSPLPARTPLKSNITGIPDRETCRIEKVVFQSLPGLYVTGNFYVPKDSTKPAVMPRTRSEPSSTIRTAPPGLRPTVLRV